MHVTDTHTHTQVNSQSQIRWQIRRLMLLGGCGIGGLPPSPLLQAVPQNIHATSHTRHSGVKAGKQTYKRRSLFYTKKKQKTTPPPIEVPAFSFTSSLVLPLPLFLTASLLLPSAASQPMEWEMTSPCCSQCGGSSMNLCVCVCVGR